MGARISQTNVYAISTLVSTSEWDVENVLRSFERRPAKWKQILVNGKMIDWIPHTANPADPRFSSLNQDDEAPPGEVEAGLEVEVVNGGGLDTRSRSSFGGGGMGDLLLEASVAGQTVSPFPSVFEGGDLEDDDIAGGIGDVGISGRAAGNAEEKTFHGNGVVGGGSWSSNKTSLPASYNISRNSLQELLTKYGINSSDAELLDKMFSLVDTRGFGETDIREILVAYSLVVAKDSIGQFLNMIFRIFDRVESFAIERKEMLHLFTLVNECFFYFGDRPIEPRYVRDLVDSVFTTSGKIDGHVNYRDFIELIEQHPIIEMMFSAQFQGLAREKVFDEHSLGEMRVTATFDYSKDSKPM